MYVLEIKSDKPGYISFYASLYNKLRKHNLVYDVVSEGLKFRNEEDYKLAVKLYEQDNLERQNYKPVIPERIPKPEVKIQKPEVKKPKGQLELF